jgi:hypothetical protein
MDRCSRTIKEGDTTSPHKTLRRWVNGSHLL